MLVLRFFIFMQGAIIARAFNFWLAFLQILLISFSKVRLESFAIPSETFHLPVRFSKY